MEGDSISFHIVRPVYVDILVIACTYHFAFRRINLNVLDYSLGSSELGSERSPQLASTVVAEKLRRVPRVVGRRKHEVDSRN